MLKLTTIALAATLTAGAAQAVTLTFDEKEYTSGTLVSSFDKQGISGSVSATGGANQAMIFDSRTLSGQDNDLVAPFYKKFLSPGNPDLTSGTTNPNNILIISEDGDSSDPDDNGSGGTITFKFDKLVDFFGFRVFDDVSNFVVTSDKGHSSTPVTLDFDNQWARVNTQFLGIQELTFNFGSASGAIDNLKLEISTVPVPAALPLLIAGIGALGLAGRRKTSKKA